MNRKVTDPIKLRLESGNTLLECETNWDSTFNDLLNIFVGLCSAAGYGDKSQLYENIYNTLDEQRLSDEEFERRRKENPILFKM